MDGRDNDTTENGGKIGYGKCLSNDLLSWVVMEHGSCKTIVTKSLEQRFSSSPSPTIYTKTKQAPVICKTGA